VINKKWKLVYHSGKIIALTEEFNDKITKARGPKAMFNEKQTIEHRRE